MPKTTPQNPLKKERETVIEEIQAQIKKLDELEAMQEHVKKCGVGSLDLTHDEDGLMDGVCLPEGNRHA